MMEATNMRDDLSRGEKRAWEKPALRRLLAGAAESSFTTSSDGATQS